MDKRKALETIRKNAVRLRAESDAHLKWFIELLEIESGIRNGLSTLPLLLPDEEEARAQVEARYPILIWGFVLDDRSAAVEATNVLRAVQTGVGIQTFSIPDDAPDEFTKIHDEYIALWDKEIALTEEVVKLHRERRLFFEKHRIAEWYEKLARDAGFVVDGSSP